MDIFVLIGLDSVTAAMWGRVNIGAQRLKKLPTPEILAGQLDDVFADISHI